MTEGFDPSALEEVKMRAGGGLSTAPAPTAAGAGTAGNGPAAALGAQKMLGFLISPAQPRLFYL